MRECNRCKNLGIDYIPDDEYGEIIYPECCSHGQNVSSKKEGCPYYEEANIRYFEHELWDDFYGE